MDTLNVVLVIVIMGLIAAVVVLVLKGNRRAVAPPAAPVNNRLSVAREARDRIVRSGRNLQQCSHKGAIREIANLVEDMISHGSSIPLNDKMFKIREIVDDYGFTVADHQPVFRAIYDVLMENHMSRQAADFAKDYNF